MRMRLETSGEANVNRVRCHGKVDQQCVEEVPGSSYYRELSNFPVVGKKKNSYQLMSFFKIFHKASKCFMISILNQM